MIKKILTFLKNVSLKTYAVLVVFILGLVWLIVGIVSKQKSKKIVQTIDKTLDKIQNKETSLTLDKQSVDIEQKVKLQTVEQQKVELTNRIEEISKIKDKRLRLEEMIKLHNEIKSRRNYNVKDILTVKDSISKELKE